MVCAARWMPHPPNFTPLVGVAIFGSAIVFRNVFAILAPVVALWLSDLFLNNLVYAQYFDGFIWVSEPFVWSALALALIAGLSMFLNKNSSWIKVGGFTLVSSALFFLVSNFGVWASATSVFSKDLSGLMTAYAAGLPFFLNGMLGDLFYTALLFGSYYWVTRRKLNLA